ncbi:hypothetical protein BT96DRAFT_959305 [Gymnopus androsaceus JB14]|uniref:Uncharacterized protein n=1 Tax=Gymnopus androsaceus JB14 TaxID=1447944 RepID=A0A6A4H366_9AGAR|nr:hypothetical protein BT96DRAFT_959305 [Gymnopus androsaceus JB14]
MGLQVFVKDLRYGLKKGISEKTAQKWMKHMGYCWKKTPKGQYINGHEQYDVVYYRQTEFLPAMSALEHCTCSWILTHLDQLGPLPQNRIIVVWFHNESMFYANNRRNLIWCDPNLKATPQPKGEGPPLMAADFVPQDYGWLCSHDGKRSAQVLFKAGKGRKGYFTNKNILAHAKIAMDILETNYPDEEHIFVFDNATTHRKQADNALSACCMPKSSSSLDWPNFGCSVDSVNADGHPFLETKQVRKQDWIPMRDTVIPGTDTVQHLYFPHNHPSLPGQFKGMAVLLEEQWFFINAYCCSLTGPQAAWAAKKYKWHHQLPDSILDKLE